MCKHISYLSLIWSAMGHIYMYINMKHMKMINKVHSVVNSDMISAAETMDETVITCMTMELSFE